MATARKCYKSHAVSPVLTRALTWELGSVANHTEVQRRGPLRGQDGVGRVALRNLGFEGVSLRQQTWSNVALRGVLLLRHIDHCTNRPKLARSDGPTLRCT